MRYYRINNYNNSAARREFPISGLHCWAVREEDAEAFSAEYPEAEEITIPEGMILLSIPWDAADEYICCEWREPEELALLWEEICEGTIVGVVPSRLEHRGYEAPDGSIVWRDYVLPPTHQILAIQAGNI